MADPLVVVTAAGAGLAIAQPWAISLWRSYIRPGSVDVHLLGTVEVGFSIWGPTLAIAGTLRALHRDAFVSHIELRVTRKKDSASHSFIWYAFRPNTIPIGVIAQQQIYLELASAFMVPAALPHRFHIVFADVETQREMHAALAPTRDAIEALNRPMGAASEELPFPHPGPYDPQWSAAAKRQYASHPSSVEAFARLTKLCYWQPGPYTLSMTVGCSRPDRKFSYEFGFELTSGDARNLELNVLPILQTPLAFVLQEPEPRLQFAYAQLKSR